MFWKLTPLSASSPVELVLDKDNFTLEELLDEEEIIQECKALNSRLINFLQDRDQVEQLLRYIVEEPSDNAENKRVFKFPFIACEIFTCEIDAILKTLVEEEQLMNLLFSFLEPHRPHSALLAGYFSKVVVCLMLRKTVSLMNYVQAHQVAFRQLVDLIGITSIMEVLIRLVGADDHMYPNYEDVMQWLADSNLLEMIVDKLNPSNPPEVHANAAETLCAITRNAQSALASKLSGPSYVARIFDHALEDSPSKSGLVHSLSVCISLLDPKRSAISSSLFHSFRYQHMYECPIPVNPETVGAMLPKLSNLLVLLNVSSNERILPTTYGELRPPLGKHRLKIVEFIMVLLKTGNEAAEAELIVSGTIKRVLNLFFEYPYNNSLHHHVESVIMSCLESKSETCIDHLLRECNLIGKIIQTERHPTLSSDGNEPTIPAAGKRAPRKGHLGHITRICNKLGQLGNTNSLIQKYLQENSEWNEWQITVLQERNAIENVYRWVCGRPTALQVGAGDSDDGDMHDRDYDVAALANNLSEALRYKIYGNEDAEEEHGTLGRDDKDVYFDDESAEVMSSLRLGDDQGSIFTNSNWFALDDNRIDNAAAGTSPSNIMEEINLNGNRNGSDSSSDDELAASNDFVNSTSSCNTNFTSMETGELSHQTKKPSSCHDTNFFQFEATDKDDMFGERPWVGWGESSDLQAGVTSKNPFIDDDGNFNVNPPGAEEVVTQNARLPLAGDPVLSNGSSTPMDSCDGSVASDVSQTSGNNVPSVFEEDVEFVGVELEGVVGEAGPLKRNVAPEKEKNVDEGAGIKEFNDVNYWRVDN